MTFAAIAYQNNYPQIFSHQDEPNSGFALNWAAGTDAQRVVR